MTSQDSGQHTVKPGTIKSLKLVNFMCHESFELTFGPRVNFVIGPNGSGKSALLTALVVVLGGRATTTSRAKKASDFVMYGKRSAKVSVVIHNYDKVMEKDQAFKPDDYGKHITVEKIIHKDDTSSKFVLKNDKDKKVSERKQELDEMLEHFGILINNPICILNQEVSKTFLHSKKGEDKFDLFMKATNLEQIEQDYQAAQESHKEWDDCNSRKTVAFRLLDAEYNGCKEKTSFLENRAKMNDTFEALNNELIWALCRDNEKMSEEVEQKIRDINNTIEEANQHIDGRRDKIRKYEEDIGLMKSKIEGIQRKMEDARKKVVDIRSKHGALKLKQSDVKRYLERCEKKIQGYEEDKKSLEKTIRDLKRQFRDQNSIDQEKRKLDIETLEREVTAAQAKEKSTRLHTDQLSSSMTDTRSELGTANLRVNSLKSRLSQSEAMLRRLKNGQQNVLRKYGDHVVRIREEIENAHKQGKFTKKPVGPLGYYLKLKSPDIAAPLELCLGRNAHAFACDNHQDMSALSNLFKKLAPSREFRAPTIITRRFGSRHNTSGHKAVDATFKTMLDYLDIENDAVFNIMVDRARLETILFIPDYTDAETLLINPASTPKNTYCAYTKDCSVMYPRNSAGGYRAFSNKASGYMLFSESTANQVKEVQREIEMLTAELRDAENIAKSIQDSLTAQRKEYDDNNDEIKRLIKEIRDKDTKLLELKTTIADEIQGLPDLEAELENYIKMIAEENLQKDKHEETLTTLAMELADVEKEKDECQKLIKLHETDRQDVHKIMDSTKSNIAEAKESVKQRLLMIENRQNEKSELSAKMETILEKLARSKVNIPADSVRPTKIRATDTIKQEQAKIQAQLRVEEEEMRDPEELMRSLQKRMQEIENLKGLKELNLENFESTTEALNQRKEGFLRLRSLTIGAVSTTFSTVMRSMKMNGELKIYLDDVKYRGEVIKKARTLDIRVDTNYTPSSQRTGSVMNDNNNNTSSGNNEREGRRLSRTQPTTSAATAPPPRAKRARLLEGGDENCPAGASEKENELKLTDARSLSGGERSFSTVAFVLALWHHCASPFKLMDEIDVFMDMVTRRVSYNALIRFAQCTEDPGQFIFFSPLELPKFDNSGVFVRVFEMPAIIRKRTYTQMASGSQGPAALTEAATNEV